ncbi:glycosyltransferase [Paenibacillus kobensis]|uniref:glycosyltransferase n=1 Tax=Paenibacillus kobensis TaxID=59841 RepID=UPI000FDBE13B|nr:glycosyltransferase [Paenibacillus kobensis]
MRILHIGEYVNGGIATYLNEIVQYQSSRHDVHVLLSRYNSHCDWQIEEDRVRYYDYRRHPKYFIRAMKQINREIERIKPDIVHLHSTFAGLLTRALLFVRREYEFKVIYCAHGWPFIMDVSGYKKRLYGLIERVLAARTDLIINISGHELQTSMKHGIPAERSVLIYSGVPDGSGGVWPAEQFDTGTINLLYIGRYDKAKGLDILTDQFRTHKFPHVTLHTAGGSILGDQSIDIPEFVVDLGWIKHSEIDRYYSMCDAVIVPSRWEGFGLVAVEAMRNSKPVICSNRAALPELIRHGVNGYVFDPDRPDELKAIIESLNKHELERMGARGRQIYLEKFTAARMNREIEAAYERLLDDNLERTSDMVWET